MEIDRHQQRQTWQTERQETDMSWGWCIHRHCVVSSGKFCCAKQEKKNESWDIRFRLASFFSFIGVSMFMIGTLSFQVHCNNRRSSYLARACVNSGTTLSTRRRPLATNTSKCCRLYRRSIGSGPWWAALFALFGSIYLILPLLRRLSK